MKLLRGPVSEIIKDGNGENMPHLEITEVILVLVISLTIIINIVKESWHYGVVVITTVQLHSTKPEIRFCTGSNLASNESGDRDGEYL